MHCRKSRPPDRSSTAKARLCLCRGSARSPSHSTWVSWCVSAVRSLCCFLHLRCTPYHYLLADHLGPMLIGFADKSCRYNLAYASPYISGHALPRCVCKYSAAMSPNAAARQGIQPLQLPRTVRERSTNEFFPYGDYQPGLYRKFGNTRLEMLPRIQRPHVRKWVLQKCIDPRVAQKLAILGPTKNLLGFSDVYVDGAVLPDFIRATSMLEVLAVYEMKPFLIDHALVLASDILQGILDLYRTGLRRETFGCGDIMLVLREDGCYFQIAGIESCEPTADRGTLHGEFSSLLTILKEIYSKIARADPHYVDPLRTLIERWVDLQIFSEATDEMLCTAAHSQIVLTMEMSDLRKELPLYFEYTEAFIVSLANTRSSV
ncbi:hypothetical protein BS50DRAFT_682431 [Corynespora cassiicola Philippines]|uniref:Uncharacterized protein n=1 Tax=Corynespora cassiicola Philippines TaxID=1448308 RepID=A0A2T2N191_CORCC|nr:hypothetical protein BS50DRAFT_682431 [Corynespora cassiicola Philippines]